MDFLKLEQVDPHGHGKTIVDHNRHPIMDGGNPRPGYDAGKISAFALTFPLFSVLMHSIKGSKGQFSVL